MDQRYPTISDICLAVDQGLLSKPEARAVLLSWFPAAKQISDAKQLLSEEQ